MSNFPGAFSRYNLIIKPRKYTLLAVKAETVTLMKKKLVLSEDYRLWLLLSKTRSSIFKLRHKKVGQYLPPNQAAALVTIWLLDGQGTPLELSRQLFLEPHSVSELVDRMEKKGLVSKRKDPEKKNVVRLTITEKGRELSQKVMGEDLIHSLLSSLNGEEKAQLWSLLSKIYTTSLRELGTDDDTALFP